MILTTENFGKLKNALTVRDMPKYVGLELAVAASALKAAESVGTQWFIAAQAKMVVASSLPLPRKGTSRQKMTTLDGKQVLLGLTPRAFEDLMYRTYVHNRLVAGPEGLREIKIPVYSFSLWRSRDKDSPLIIAAVPSVGPQPKSRRGKSMGIQMSLPGFGEPELVEKPAGFKPFNGISPHFS